MTDEVLHAAMVAFKQGDPDKIITTSSGLRWLREPMERTLDVVQPMIAAQERQRLGQQALQLESHIDIYDEREYVLMRDVLDLLRTGTVD